MSDENRDSTMSENASGLRTRIAVAIMHHCYGVYMDDAVNAADAVIRELNLRPERGWGNGSRQTTRYVTDWKADDE